jgi:hypothetical protein
MLYLKNELYTVEVLDPAEDLGLLGARYCRGGQVFQVKSKGGKELFSGPNFPNDYNPFDSQGLPDAFNSYPNLEGAKLGDDIFVIGVGLVKYAKPIETFFACDNRDLKQSVEWDVKQSDNSLSFECKDEYQGWAYTFKKKLELIDGKLKFDFELKNTGEKVLPVSWFAHPFFFHNKNQGIGKLPVEQEANPFYEKDSEGKFYARLPQNYDGAVHNTFAMGQAIQNGDALSIPYQHDQLSGFKIDCRFQVAQFPVWFNDKTTSPEPFLIDELRSGDKLSWGIDYTFS